MLLPEFNPTDTTFNVENAFILMRASQAAYAEDNKSYFGRLKELGIKAKDQLWFAKDYDAGFLAWTDEFAWLVFRGTDNTGGWISNLYGAIPVSNPDYYGKVHPGFSSGLDDLWEILYLWLMENLDGRPLFITGHSRGGALATLAAQFLVYMGIKPAAVYTFGSPRVGNATFAKKYNVKNHYRVENDRDIVVRLPLEPLFRHVGRLHWIDGDGNVDVGVRELEFIDSALRAALGVSLGPIGFALLQRTLPSEAFSDHSNTQYAYWLWHQLEGEARNDAAKSKYP